MENKLIDENLTTQENTPPPISQLNGEDIWARTARHIYFGEYDHTKGVDAAVKDIFLTKIGIASRSEYQTIVGSFICGSAWSIILQTYTAFGTFGSAIVFGYGRSAEEVEQYIRYYTMVRGTINRALINSSFTTI